MKFSSKNKTSRIGAIATTALAAMGVGVLPLVPPVGAATTPAVTPAKFTYSQMHVTAGTNVTMHWAGATNATYLLSDASTVGLPNFASSAVNAGTGAVWSAAGY